MKPYYEEDGITIYNAKAEIIMPVLHPDVIITDPPYPDYYEEEYNYYDGIINFLADYDCRQLIFWSAKVNLPLNYTAKHVWNKTGSKYASYEYIYERNGQRNYYLFNGNPVTNTTMARFGMDVFTGHKSQKPIKLMTELVEKFTEEGQTILDPFMGSGTTLVAAKQLGRKAVGIEISQKYCDIAIQRLSQMELFNG